MLNVIPTHPHVLGVLSDTKGGYIGKSYRINATVLARRNSKDSENSGVFCSELVAKAYKELGLLGEKIPAAKYWPGSFSRARNLRFLKQRKLGDESQLEF